jgi:hypothetical protein
MRGARLGLTLLVLACAATLSGQSAPDGLLRGDGPIPPLTCGTTRDESGGGRVRPLALPNGLADGEPFTFDQDPPLVFADYTGPITLHNFSVVGDVPSVQFFRTNTAAPDGVTETWNRKTTRSVNGQLISVFEPSWTSADLDAAFGYRRVGYDRPFLYWGAFDVPGGSTQRSVYLRVGFRGFPSSQVVRINDQVQYASDVVNIVVPTFDDARVPGGMNGFDSVAATKLFYQYFNDAYDVIGFQSASIALGDFAAFHRNVRNPVSGINLTTFDNSRIYNSNGVLQGIEAFVGSFGVTYDVTDHEMSHQWNSNFDWTRIANVSRAGHQPAAHSPLWTGGETLVGAVLVGDRRVTGSAGAYTIEQTTVPAHFHPIELYAMGLLPPGQVPDFAVFTNQGQFDPDTATSPDAGTAVTGDTVPVSMNDIVRATGSRQGPAISSVWRRATVVVSKSQLMSQQEMDYWNFFAQRLGDRNHQSRPAYDNFVSFWRATLNAVDLRTAALPNGASALAQTLDTDTPTFSPTDWRGVSFDSPVPSHVAVGQTVTLTGRVIATDRSDFSSLNLTFYAPSSTTSIRFGGAVSSSGGFSIAIRFTDAQKGSYYLSDYLFWPNSGSQYPRGSVGTITVE